VADSDYRARLRRIVGRMAEKTYYGNKYHGKEAVTLFQQWWEKLSRMG
jgi:hypothetical protein